MTGLTIYHYPNCTTCKRALAWLMEHNVSAKPIDIVEQPPTMAELKRALVAVGGQLNKLFNTSGQLYREGNYKARLASMSQTEALEELSKHGKLIKRPLLIGPGVTLVGFNVAEYESAFR